SGHNYAVVSDFAYVTRIHLRRYKLDAFGSPTYQGWNHCNSFRMVSPRTENLLQLIKRFDDGKAFVIKDCLLLPELLSKM
ncbi:PC4 domain-containing protein, partial [Trichonephila clavipes]